LAQKYAKIASDPSAMPKHPIRAPARIARKTSTVFMPRSLPATEPLTPPLPKTGTITMSTMAKTQRLAIQR